MWNDALIAHSTGMHCRRCPRLAAARLHAGHYPAPPLADPHPHAHHTAVQNSTQPLSNFKLPATYMRSLFPQLQPGRRQPIRLTFFAADGCTRLLPEYLPAELTRQAGRYRLGGMPARGAAKSAPCYSRVLGVRQLECGALALKGEVPEEGQGEGHEANIGSGQQAVRMGEHAGGCGSKAAVLAAAPASAAAAAVPAAVGAMLAAMNAGALPSQPQQQPPPDSTPAARLAMPFPPAAAGAAAAATACQPSQPAAAAATCVSPAVQAQQQGAGAAGSGAAAALEWAALPALPDTTDPGAAFEALLDLLTALEVSPYIPGWVMHVRGWMQGRGALGGHTYSALLDLPLP